MGRLFVLCIIVGGFLVWLGMRRFKTARQQGVLLVALGVLLNAWWLVFLVMDSLKTGAHWREREGK
jgi:drug/metabolite transporter superfamily protein YnfA